NTNNPDTGGANWAPIDGYGITAVTGLTNANVTLSATQYAKKIITLAGTLTGNVQIIFPTTMQQWLVVNNTTGAFTVTCKTASGTGAAVPQGGVQSFWGDGTNLNLGPGDAKVISAVSDPTFANNSASAASTSWVRGAMAAIATAAGFAVSIGTNSYVKLPSWLGGIVFQWGGGTSNASGVLAVTFPLSFPNACRSVVATANSTGQGVTTRLGGAPTTTGVSIETFSTGTGNPNPNTPLYWIAIGN
ncbi:gp53-like domain-containing protein, partial [Herbaspirillum chlorophenolicum]